MDTKVNYVFVGIFVVLLSAAIIIATAWISGGRGAKSYKKYVTYINETVAGLNEKAAVKFNGVEVGFVEEITLNPKNPQQVKLLLDIDSQTPVNSSTVAFLQSQGITGYMFVALKANKPFAPKIEKTPGEKYPVISSKASFLFQLDNAVESITSNISNVSDSLEGVLSKDNQKAFSTILVNLEEISTIIKQNSKELDGMIKSANKTFENTAKASNDFPQLAHKLDDTLTETRRMARSLSSASEHYDILDKAKELLASVQSLTDQLNENPAILIRGKAAATKGPGE